MVNGHEVMCRSDERRGGLVRRHPRPFRFPADPEESVVNRTHLILILVAALGVLAKQFGYGEARRAS